MTRHCLDLFSGLGGWSSAFDESPEWEVTTVDLDPDGRFEPDIQADVLELTPGDLPDADVVLASPPCKVFTISRGWDHWDDHGLVRPAMPDDERIPEHVGYVYQTLYLINQIEPDWWYLENPRGFMRKLIGLPSGTVNYCQYGSKFMKPTDLWGRHPPMEYRQCSPGADCHVESPRSMGTMRDHVRDPAERAKVPYGLSETVLEAVESAYRNPPPEQSTLELVTDGGHLPSDIRDGPHTIDPETGEPVPLVLDAEGRD